jgi:hypothetical protein
MLFRDTNNIDHKKTEGVIRNGQYRDTNNIDHKKTEGAIRNGKYRDPFCVLVINVVCVSVFYIPDCPFCFLVINVVCVNQERIIQRHTQH